MPTARRSEAAERDLQNIAFHIAFADRRPLVADRIIDELIAEAEKLADHLPVIPAP
jgi:plasmid stabilization system protein ParE